MKILWYSNPPVIPSGYGQQSEMFGTRIAAAGHDVAFYANYGISLWQPEWNGFHIYPGDTDWGNRTMPACALHHADGDDCLVIGLADSWVLKPELWPSEIRMALWAPVDTHPLPERSRAVLAHPSVTPVAMSRFGERMMSEAGLHPIYVPHGIDTQVFRPRPDDRAEIRAELDLPENAFVVGMVAANRGYPLWDRKAFPQVLHAFGIFRERHRDAVLYLHTNEMIEGDSGLLLRRLAASCGIPRRALKITDAFMWQLGVRREDVARIVSSFDVLASPSMGEGFGIPIVEAQACGVPVIVTDHSAMSELCGAGWLVDGDPWYSGALDAWFKCPSIDGILEALEHAYAARDDVGLSDRAREFALPYDVDTVMGDYWLPALEQLERPSEIGPLLPARAEVAA